MARPRKSTASARQSAAVKKEAAKAKPVLISELTDDQLTDIYDELMSMTPETVVHENAISVVGTALKKEIDERSKDFVDELFDKFNLVNDLDAEVVEAVETTEEEDRT